MRNLVIFKFRNYKSKILIWNCQMSNGKIVFMQNSHFKMRNCQWWNSHWKIVKCQMGKLSSCKILKLSFRNCQWWNSHWELSNSKCENCIIREYIERWQKASSLKFVWGKLNVKCVMGKFSLEILKFKFRNYKSEFSLGIVKCQMGKFVIICKILICEIAILKFRNYKSEFSLGIVIL